MLSELDVANLGKRILTLTLTPLGWTVGFRLGNIDLLTELSG